MLNGIASTPTFLTRWCTSVDLHIAKITIPVGQYCLLSGLPCPEFCRVNYQEPTPTPFVAFIGSPSPE